MNDIIYYSDFFKSKDFKSDFTKKYKNQIVVYKDNVSEKFCKLLIKQLLKDYFKRNENINIDFRVFSVKLFYNEICDAIIGG